MVHNKGKRIASSIKIYVLLPVGSDMYPLYWTSSKEGIWKGQEKTDRKLRAIKEIEIQIELGLTSQAQNGCV